MLEVTDLYNENRQATDKQIRNPLTKGRNVLLNMNGNKRCMSTLTLCAPFRIYHGTGAAIPSEDRTPTTEIIWFSTDRTQSEFYKDKISMNDRIVWDYGAAHSCISLGENPYELYKRPFYFHGDDIDEAGNIYAYDLVESIPLLLDLRNYDKIRKFWAAEIDDLDSTVMMLARYRINGWVGPNEIALLRYPTVDGTLRDIKSFISVDLASEKHWINPSIKTKEDFMGTYLSEDPIYAYKSLKFEYYEATEDEDLAQAIQPDMKVKCMKLNNGVIKDCLFVETWEDWNSLVSILEYNGREYADKSPFNIIASAIEKLKPKAIRLSHLFCTMLILMEDPEFYGEVNVLDDEYSDSMETV